ncbi:MAG TPA: transporter substrate-binding domain-containing protein [Firmicutes bacterium]|nr:transporter substrate-binding domain-containing protein [Bacillota bacterium]
MDAFIYDTMSIHKLWKQYESSTKANLEPFEEKIQDWAIGIRKGNDELKEQINDFLRQYKEEGKFDLLAEKYLADVKKDFDDLGIRFFF